MNRVLCHEIDTKRITILSVGEYHRLYCFSDCVYRTTEVISKEKLEEAAWWLAYWSRNTSNGTLRPGYIAQDIGCEYWEEY